MELPEKLHHSEVGESYARSESSSFDIIETVNAIIDYLASKEESIVGGKECKSGYGGRHNMKLAEDDVIECEDCKMWWYYQKSTQAQEKEICLCPAWLEDGNGGFKKNIVCEHDKKDEPVSERNALIDELVEDMKRMMAFGKAETSDKIWVGNGNDCLYVKKEHVIALLKSKNK